MILNFLKSSTMTLPALSAVPGLSLGMGHCPPAAHSQPSRSSLSPTSLCTCPGSSWHLPERCSRGLSSCWLHRTLHPALLMGSWRGVGSLLSLLLSFPSAFRAEPWLLCSRRNPVDREILPSSQTLTAGAKGTSDRRLAEAAISCALEKKVQRHSVFL